MAGFGSFMGGFASGLEAGDKLRTSRQMQKIRKSAIKRMESEDNIATLEKDEFYKSHPELTRPEAPSEDLGDPFIMRLGSAIGGMFGKTKPKAIATAPTTTTEEVGPPSPPPLMTTGMDVENPSPGLSRTGTTPDETMYADGGRLRKYADGDPVHTRSAPHPNTPEAELEWSRRQAEQIRAAREAATARAAANPTPTATEPPVTPAPEGAKYTGPKMTGTGAVGQDMVGAAERVGQFRPPSTAARVAAAVSKAAESPAGKLVGGLAKRVALPAAVAATEYNIYNTDTEDYRKRFGLETKDPSFWGDVGVRTLGAASDVANTASFGLLGRWFKDQHPRQGVPAPAAPSAPAGQKPAAAPPAPTSTPTPQSPSTSGATPPPPPATSQGGDELDNAAAAVQQMSPVDVPNYSMDDWADFRVKAMRGLIERGATPADAFDAVDKQVMGLQQRGFIRFAQQGLARLQYGDIKGAGSLFRAAFQYFPTGTDVKFGTQNGTLFAMSVDEKTGQPVGNPMALTRESVASMIENFSNPAAFRTWLGDRRKSQLELRKLLTVDEPTAQALGNARQISAEADLTRARTAAEKERNAGGLGVNSADWGRFEARLGEVMSLIQVADPAEANRIKSLISQAKQANPNVDNDTIIFMMLDQMGIDSEALRGGE